MFKKIIKPILIIILAIILLFVAYCAYVLISYHRIDDNTKLEINGSAAVDSLKTNELYRISSANLGFGAYSDDYSFFMDGGTESWAFSKEAVNENINGSIDSVLTLAPNLMLFQEVDIDSTRSYHVNEEDLIINNISNKGYGNVDYTFALNYDSPFLLYPLTQPHGKSKAGLLTVSTASITDLVRRSLPSEEGLSTLIDLDRCYAKNYIELENGLKLTIDYSRFISGGKTYYTWRYSASITLYLYYPLMAIDDNGTRKIVLLTLPNCTSFKVNPEQKVSSLLTKKQYLDESMYTFNYFERTDIESFDKKQNVLDYYSDYNLNKIEDNKYTFDYLNNRFVLTLKETSFSVAWQAKAQ